MGKPASAWMTCVTIVLTSRTGPVLTASLCTYILQVYNGPSMLRVLPCPCRSAVQCLQCEVIHRILLGMRQQRSTQAPC